MTKQQSTQPKYSIFLSYSRRDNERVLGSLVTKLYSIITAKLEQLLPYVCTTIFFDKHHMDETGEIPETLKENASKAELLIAVLSPGYKESEWCELERESFLEKYKNETRGNCFLVDLGTLRHEDKPKEFKDIPGFDFYGTTGTSKNGIIRTLDADSKLFADKCIDIAEKIAEKIKSKLDQKSISIATTKRRQVQKTKKILAVNDSINRKIQTQVVAASFPTPFANLINHSQNQFSKSRKEETREIATDLAKDAINGMENFVAAISLAELWRNVDVIHRAGFIQLRKQMLESSQSINQSFTSSEKLETIVNTCVKSIKLLSENCDSSSSKFFTNDLPDALTAISAIKQCVSSRLPVSSAGATSVLDSLNKAPSAVESIKRIFDNKEIIIPTRIYKTSTTVEIQSFLMFDSKTWKWKTQDVNLSFDVSDPDYRSKYWNETVSEKISPLLISKSFLTDSQPRKKRNIFVTCEQACSLFPFVFTKVVKENEVEFFIYDDISICQDITRATNIDTVSFLKVTNSSCRKVPNQKQQQFAPILALEKFVSSVIHRSGKFNLAVSPESIDSQHEYVLCGKIEGREVETAEIDRWIADQTKPTVFCWEAFGGDGKSALVNNWFFLRPESQELLRDNGFEGALWADFYQPNFGLCDFARCFLKKIGLQENHSSDPEILDRFFAEVSTRQYLFVLDGVERLLLSEELSDKEIGSLIKEHGILPRKYRYCRSFSVEPTNHRLSKSINDDFFVRLAEIPNGASRFLMTTRFCPTGIEDLKSNSNAVVTILEPISSSAAQGIWWTAAGRGPLSDAEECSVESAIELLGRHPLTIRILASTIGDQSFDDWRRDLRLKQGETPFDEKIRGENPDSRTRCSEAIWACGAQLHKEESIILKAIDRISSGSVYLKDLQANPLMVSTMGQYTFDNKFRSIVQKLTKNGWVGLSQGNLLNLHPMVRQFAKDARDNRGYSKNQSLSPAQYDLMLNEIDAKLTFPTPLYDSAWKQILRREPWSTCMKLSSNKVYTYASIEKLTKIMLKFLPSEASETYPLPKLSTRFDQCIFLQHLGSLYAHLGDYKKSMEFLRFAMWLGDLLGSADIVTSCKNSILWVSLYEGDLETAEGNFIDTNTSPILEVCLALRGARSKEFADVVPSTSACPNWTDRRWLFQTLAEANFWRRELEPCRLWINVLRKHIDSNTIAEYDVLQTQKMWEDWTFGVSLAEDLIESGNFAEDKINECLKYLERSFNSASDAQYSIVASLSLAFEIRFLSFILKNHPNSKKRFIENIDRFHNNPFLQRPHAVALVEIAELREQLNRRENTNRNLSTIYNRLSLEGREFYFGLIDLHRLLDDNPNVEVAFRGELNQLVNRLSNEKAVESAKSIKFAQEVHVSNEGHESSQNGASISFAKNEKSEWKTLNDKYGKEISYFKGIVQIFGGSESDFAMALSASAKTKSQIDPLAAVVEIVCKEIEGGKNSDFIDRANMQNHLADIRERGFEDFNQNIAYASRMWSKTEDLQSSTAGRRFLDSLLKDSQRLLGMGDFNEPLLTIWRDRVAIHLFHESNIPDVFFPFFETVLRARVSLSDLVKGIRLPSNGCYRASLYRIKLEQVLPRFSRVLSAEQQEDLRYWRAMYLCGWGTLDSDLKKTWEIYCSKIPKHLVMKVVDELRKMDSGLSEFIACIEQNKSDNPQGNLSFLKYKKRIDLRASLNSIEKEIHRATTANRLSLEQQIKVFRSRLPFWEENNEQTDN